MPSHNHRLTVIGDIEANRRRIHTSILPTHRSTVLPAPFPPPFDDTDKSRSSVRLTVLRTSPLVKPIPRSPQARLRKFPTHTGCPD